MIEFFDIGNHLELAGRLRTRRQFERCSHLPAFSVETNKSIYLAANGGTPKAEPPGANSRVKVRDLLEPVPGYETSTATNSDQILLERPKLGRSHLLLRNSHRLQR